MKNSYKIVTVFLLLLLFISAQTMYSQTMNVILNNGSTQNYPMLSTSKVYFSSNNLVFADSNTSTPIDQIRKITFTASTDVENPKDSLTQLILFPNPAKNILTLSTSLTDESYTVYIMSVTGALVFSTSVNSSNTSINVAHLSSGVYFVKVNGLTAKFIKL